MGLSPLVASRVGSGYFDGEGGGTRRCASGSIGLDIAMPVLDLVYASGQKDVSIKLPWASGPDQRRPFAA